MPFLIDGHNVIAALQDIDLEDPDDEAKLVMKLRAWSSRAQRKAIVVFDGGLPGGPSRTMSSSDVKVVFAARFHTNADRIIGERLSDLPDAPNWTVVSSDREILDHARATGARILTAQEFAELLNLAPAAATAKPTSISPAEVEAWLQIFPEPEPGHVQAAHTPPIRRAEPAPGNRAKSRRARRSRVPEPERSTRTIGDQLGVGVPPDPEADGPKEKPRLASAAEVDQWLEIFHDDPDSHIPPPRLPKRKREPEPSRPPVVNKAGGLSSSEVDTWLSVFGEEEQTEPQSATAAQQKPRPHGLSPKLARHQENLASTEEQQESELSQDDLELWHRLFDDG